MVSSQYPYEASISFEILGYHINVTLNRRMQSIHDIMLQILDADISYGIFLWNISTCLFLYIVLFVIVIVIVILTESSLQFASDSCQLVLFWFKWKIHILPLHMLST